MGIELTEHIARRILAACVEAFGAVRVTERIKC